MDVSPPSTKVKPAWSDMTNSPPPSINKVTTQAKLSGMRRRSVKTGEIGAES